MQQFSLVGGCFYDNPMPIKGRYSKPSRVGKRRRITATETVAEFVARGGEIRQFKRGCRRLLNDAGDASSDTRSAAVVGAKVYADALPTWAEMEDEVADGGW